MGVSEFGLKGLLGSSLDFVRRVSKVGSGTSRHAKSKRASQEAFEALRVQGPMADLAAGTQEERNRQCLDEFDGLTAPRQLTVCGLDGSELQLPLADDMTVDDLRMSIAGRIGLRLGGMLLLAAGGNGLDDSQPLSEQVHGDVITYVVQQVALGMVRFPPLLGVRGSYSEDFYQRVCHGPS